MATKTNVVHGTDGEDIMSGTAGEDEFAGGRSNDFLIGGGGNDTLKGEDGDDRLFGDDGNDTLKGGAGNDQLVGGRGDDILEGGTGHDTFTFQRGHGNDTVVDFDVNEDVIDITFIEPDGDDFQFANKDALWEALGKLITPVEDPDNPETVTGVQIDLSDWGGGVITLEGVLPGELAAEHFATWLPERTLHTGDESITGTNADDTLRGGLGNDVLLGWYGHDTLYGGAGDDTLTGWSGNDTLYGGDGNDTLEGSAGDDTLTGGAGGDVFVYAPSQGNDVITDFNVREDVVDLSSFHITKSDGTSAFFSSDILEALSNSITSVTDPNNPDHVTGVRIDLSEWGGGTITLQGVLPGELAADNIDSGFGRNLGTGDETLTGTRAGDTLRGGLGDDWIYGKKGDDEIDGGLGDDRLFGGKGNDTLVGGAGNDDLTGGKGRDTFVHEPGGGHDTITDFSDRDDVLDLSAFTELGQFSDLTAMLRQDGDHVVIDLSEHDGGTITLQNADLDDLDADDFIFFDMPVEGGI